jgi:hypothetical protein
MNIALTAIIIATGGASLVRVLVSRMQGRRRDLRRSHDGVGSDGGYCTGDDIGSLVGSAGTATPDPTAPHPATPPAPMMPAVRAIRAQAIVGEAVGMEEEAATAEATSGPRPFLRGLAFPRDYSRGFLDSFQFESSISLESLEKAVFPFASRPALN